MLLWTLYYQEVRNFLKSLTITNQGMAAVYERQTLLRFDAATLYPQANPYYARVCGNYTDQDDMIYVQSLDTGASIPFTKEMLAAHSRTRAYYHFTGSGYPILCRAYPDKVDLIKAIVCPVQVNLDLWDVNSEAYAHFCGDYVTGETEMTIVHPQTGATVAFTKANLDASYVDNENVTHTLRETYRLPSQAYFDLLKRYPSRYDLIHGIINPSAPVEQIIAAGDLALVGYDLTVLQEREAQSILNAVQKTLQYIKVRWHVPEFQYEEYYNVTFWSLLWYILPLTIYAQRVQNLRTPQVHPLSMWEYLSSYGLSDEYNEGLSVEQAWFLYKNLVYLLKHKGTQGALTKLIDGLLSKLNTTLKTKHLLLNTTSYPTTVIATPEILSRDFTEQTTPMEDFVHGVETLPTIIQRECDAGLEPNDTDEEVARQTKLLQRAPVTRLPTKLIEVRKLDRDDRETYPYYEFALHTSIYWWSLGAFNYKVPVALAELGTEYTFSYGEIVALLHYLIGGTTVGTTYTPPTLIPTSFNLRAVINRPVPSTMTDVIAVPHVGDVAIGDILDIDTMLEDIPDVMRNMALSLNVMSKEDLIAQLDEQYTALYTWFIQIRESADTPFHLAMNRFLFNVLNVGTLSNVVLVPGVTTYEQWIAAVPTIQGLVDEYAVSEEKRSVLVELLLSTAYPIERSQYAGGYSMSVKQYALMRSLFTRLCSYNVAFLNTEVHDINYIALKPITVQHYDSQLTVEVVADLTQYQILDDWPAT